MRDDKSLFIGEEKRPIVGGKETYDKSLFVGEEKRPIVGGKETYDKSLFVGSGSREVGENIRGKKFSKVLSIVTFCSVVTVLGH